MMMTLFQKGIRRASFYYGFGYSAIILMHLFIGWEQQILMPKSFIIHILIVLTGVTWAIINVTNLFSGTKNADNFKDSQDLGELIVHVISILLFVFFVQILRT